MRKYSLIITIIISLIALNIESFSQTAYYDAIRIKKMIITTPSGDKKVHPDSVNSLLKILSRHDMQVISSTSLKIVSDKYDENPFISTDQANITFDAPDNFTGLFAGETESLFSSFSSLSITTIADGLAKFLVKRTKEELNVAFFRRFRELFEPYPEFRALFPRTYEFISLIEEQNYASMIQVLKEAFEEDMYNLVGNIPKLTELEACPPNDGKCATRKVAIEAFFKTEKGHAVWASSVFVDQLIKGENVATALTSIIEEDSLMQYNNSPNQSNVISAISMLEMFSSSLLSKDDNEIWISKKEIQDHLIDDNITRTIYLGLIYQQSKTRNIIFSYSDQKVGLHEVLEKFKSAENDFTTYLNAIKNSTSELETSIKNIKRLRQEGKELTLSSIASYLNNINSFISGIEIFIKNFPPSYNAYKEELINSVQSLKKTVSLSIKTINDIEHRNYGSIIFNTVVILEDALKSSDTQLNENLQPLKKRLLRYGTFVAVVAQAENSDEVSAAIEAVALPSGSSSIKRKSAFNVSLNAYVGAFVGEEKILEYGNGAYDWVAGITAPVGVSVSWGDWNLWIVKGATIHVSVIDIGAVTTYRFDDGNVEDLPELTFQNILAPGLHGFINFKNSPISLGGGYQLGPSTREINGVDESIRRWNMTLAVDIPLINFYTKTK